MPAGVREEIQEPLRRTLAWLASLRDRDGRILCPDHKIEHTGKSAYTIVSACELLALDPARDAAFLRELAIGQARRLVLNLVREGESPCHTFRPGFHDPFNNSNNVIDGGAASDALATIVRALGPSLDAQDRERFSEASLLHARTYLRYAVLDKGIPAQRAWGLTGLAGAFALERDPVLEEAAVQAVSDLAAIQHVDGSYPYHPIAWGGEHPGAGDVSSFYQSRLTGFLLHALPLLGRDPASRELRAQLDRGVDFLLALHGPDGVKCGFVEAKPWYWGASYEVASHPFDVQALCGAARVLGTPGAGVAAVRAFRAWVAHLLPSGEPRSHLPGPGRERSYQCSLFWAAHAAWIARAAVELEYAMREEAANVAHPAPPRVRWFADAHLARLEDERVVAWVRGARPAVNVHHGSPHGAGLLRVYDKKEKRDLLERSRLGGSNEGEWSGVAGSSSFARGWRSGGGEMRFSLWLARVHARAGRLGSALAAPARVFRRGVLAFAEPHVSSAFDLAPEVHVLSEGVLLASALAHRDGSRLENSSLERTFRVRGKGLEVEDRLLSAGNAGGVAFALPKEAASVSSDPDHVSYRMPKAPGAAIG